MKTACFAVPLLALFAIAGCVGPDSSEDLGEDGESTSAISGPSSQSYARLVRDAYLRASDADLGDIERKDAPAKASAWVKLHLEDHPTSTIGASTVTKVSTLAVSKNVGTVYIFETRPLSMSQDAYDFYFFDKTGTLRLYSNLGKMQFSVPVLGADGSIVRYTFVE
jgi:hypothetical protein